jgi:hypothetical protein
MLHGFGNNKHEWESTTDEADGADKYHWNNHWFAAHGYYVVNYTARGFSDSGPAPNSTQPNTPADPTGSEDTPNGTIHLKSRDYEIRDTQWLAALVAATFPDVDPHRVAVTGGSYGGIESWTQASQAQWTFPNAIDPSLPLLDLQVAVPKYPATDLAYALAPNGHGGGPSGADASGNPNYSPMGTDVYESSQGSPESDTGDGNPIGTPKESFITGLFAEGAPPKGVFESGSSTDTPPCTYGNCEGPISIPLWKTRVDAGDPFDNCPDAPSMALPGGSLTCDQGEDPLVRQIRRGLTEFRGSYYQDEGWKAQLAGRKVAVFSIQGWTDDLFPAIESFRQFKYLKRLDPRWPVEVALADIGHSRAQNKPQTWHHLNHQAWQWLQSNINGSHDQDTTVSSQQTTCANDGDPGSAHGAAGQDVTAKTPEGLANGSLSIQYPGGSTVSPLGGVDPNGLATDALTGEIVQPGEPCHTSDGPAVGGYTQYSPPLRATTTYIGLGVVHVNYTFVGDPPATATLDARLFDRAPDGTELLMTRGTYRLNAPPTSGGTLDLPLYGNHWRLEPGHKLRLDLTQVDFPTYRPSNEPSSFQFSGVTLTLPILEAGSRTLS